MSDAFLAALDEDAREHRESFTGRKRSGSNVSASNVQVLPMVPGPTNLGAAIPNRPATSLSAALEEDARELREEAFQNRRSSISTTNIPISPRKGTAMASVFGNKRITLPGDLVSVNCQVNLQSPELTVIHRAPAIHGEYPKPMTRAPNLACLLVA